MAFFLLLVTLGAKGDATDFVSGDVALDVGTREGVSLAFLSLD